MSTQSTVLDVIIVGAGISGVGAAYHLQSKCPGKSYAILEGRSSMGGTWDLFKYPGIRSDSDMYTLGFSFNPWEDPKAIVDGPSILQYIKDTAAKFGIDKRIRFNHKVVDASWTDEDGLWTLTVAAYQERPEQKLQCRFLYMCSGYYSYDEGYLPEFPGYDTFQGRIVHPQFWDPSLDYAGKRVILIGSGATAITLAPELAKTASQVYMLQRSPSYVVNRPGDDPLAPLLTGILPGKQAYELVRWKNILLSLGFYNAARQFPDAIRKLVRMGIRKELGEDYDMRHFDPSYKPWDQRLCVVPDADLFQAIKSGDVEVVTDTIRTFTEDGILLDSGRELKADIIITATGLKLQLMGGMSIKINGVPGESGEAHCYRGMMLSGAPNFAFSVGYTNSSWTLKSELSSEFVTRLLNYMDRKGYKVCTPRFDSSSLESRPLLDFDAGYVKRAAEILPKQGSRSPWKVYQNYLIDTVFMKFTPVADRYLEFR